MKCFFQLIDKKNGTRSESVGCTRAEFARVLIEKVPAKKLKQVFVLVLVDDANKKEWEFSRAPLMRGDTFVSLAQNFDLDLSVQGEEAAKKSR